jgi:hypothetical protein
MWAGLLVRLNRNVFIIMISENGYSLRKAQVLLREPISVALHCPCIAASSTSMAP